MSSWSGKTLGNVNIGDLIARGGMAEVYQGIHTTLDRKVAVKIMRDHVEEDPDSRARFGREARVVAGLDHTNIIKIFDYNLVDGRPFLVMELVTGASLANYLKALQKRGEKLPYETAARLLAAVASALDYAHERGIVHRDIKPANILLRSKSGQIDLEAPLPEDVEPVLTDFGLVRLLDGSTQTSTGTVSGTPSYMSPEQARGDRVNQKTDIYSLGVALYEMLAGAVPFDAESSFGVLMKHINEPPPPIPGISKDLQAVINRALAKSPDQRYDTAGDFVREFIAVHHGETVSETTKQVQELLAATQAETVIIPPPSRVPYVAGGVIALALAVFAAVWLLRPPQASPSPLDKDQPVGRITFTDYNYLMDKVLITVNGLPPPQAGTHYEAWFIGQGGETRRNIGKIAFEGESGKLDFTNLEGDNLLEAYDQVQVTIEPDDDPAPNEPSGEIAASHIFPPLALIHVRHLVSIFKDTPDEIGLIQGLWNAAYIMDESALALGDAFADGDEIKTRAFTEEIINQIAGSENKELYQDWDGDGKISDPVEGYGFLQNGDPGYGAEQGYLSQTMSHARFAADAPDATRNIVENKDYLEACVANMQGWGKEMLRLALQLQETPFGQDMEPIVAELQSLSAKILYGDDANQNGLVETAPGECGAGNAYEFAYRMAEMPLLPGANRIPPPASAPLP